MLRLRLCLIALLALGAAGCATLEERAQVPDDYSMLSRVIGLYALSKIPFTSGVRRYQEEVLAAYRREPAVPEGGAVVPYSPPAVTGLSRATIAGILKHATAEPLGILEPSDADLFEKRFRFELQ